jgi:hypothetical protein
VHKFSLWAILYDFGAMRLCYLGSPYVVLIVILIVSNATRELQSPEFSSPRQRSLYRQERCWPLKPPFGRSPSLILDTIPFFPNTGGHCHDTHGRCCHIQRHGAVQGRPGLVSTAQPGRWLSFSYATAAALHRQSRCWRRGNIRWPGVPSLLQRPRRWQSSKRTSTRTLAQ